ncbi:MAG: hypothetical protein BroJett003_12390 [Planctomycetota bacterium]|nr:MAG: hypothetical protein BroJett003_12390 [Planctomycetota bacterium]
MSGSASPAGARDPDREHTFMKRLAVLLLMAGAAWPVAASEFEKPVQLKGGDEIIKVEAPGYAFPCLADLDRDGKADLLVGQFKEGKIRVFKGLGGMKFGPGEWLKAGGEVAQVPGVW